VVITFVSSCASVEEEPVLTAVQLLWINIIMDTFAALALATDPASEKHLDRKPDSMSTPLFSVDMYKQIFGQFAHQIAISLIFHFLGLRILDSMEAMSIMLILFRHFCSMHSFLLRSLTLLTADV
jgi:P-type Ca2+ transporter type 2C